MFLMICANCKEYLQQARLRKDLVAGILFVKTKCLEGVSPPSPKRRAEREQFMMDEAI